MAAFSVVSAPLGVLMSAKALLDKTPKPSDQELLDALEGNICRCTRVPTHFAIAARCDRPVGAGKNKSRQEGYLLVFNQIQ
jgi:xanthine dehydrogenase iron-sulfur cluster and FAD-binding subunit A